MNFGEKERPRQELSIAPLIDIVFLLLVFFMLAGSFLNLESLDMDSPGTADSSGASGETESLVVRLHEDGAVTVNEVVISPDRIGDRMRQARLADDDLRVLVVAPSEEAVQRLITVVDDIREAGVSTIGVAVDESP